MIRVQLSYATFGLIVHDGVILEAAPIAAWTRGRPARQVWDYYARRGHVSWHP
jgi:hypothetical protein